jgi:hypothetical protein
MHKRGKWVMNSIWLDRVLLKGTGQNAPVAVKLLFGELEVTETAVVHRRERSL